MALINIQVHLIFNKIKGVKDSIISVLNNSTENNSQLKKEFQKIEIPEEDREKFIGKIELPKRIIERTLSKEAKLNVNSWNYLHENFKLNEEVVSDFSKIVLLGNPGIGKSIELKKIALECWNNKNDSYVPIFKNLRNFTTQDKIEDFLRIDLDSYKRVFFLFDGIDEISDVQNFLDFLNYKNKQESSKTTDFYFKILISCRTNVFRKEIYNLSDFNLFFLNNLLIEDSVSYVKEETGYTINSVKDISSNLISFLKNPNALKIVCNYIKVKNELPKNTSELWQIYIDERLKGDSKYKFIKKKIKSPLIKKYSKKIAFINELTNTTIVSENNLGNIFEDISNFDDFIKNPLIDREVENDNWFFEHKEVQEYFASKLILDSYNINIIELIKIKGINKTKSVLFNTITFLINLMDKKSDKYRELIDWLVEYEPEILFRADSDRVDEKIRVLVFKKFFIEKCINTTLWLSTSKYVEVEQIAKFADCDDNLFFLIDTIKDTNIHFRSRISAISILSYFRLSKIHKTQVKEVFYELLKNDEVSKDEKSSIIDFFCNNIDFKYNEIIISEIITIFNKETNNNINSSLLHLLGNSNNIDKYSNYILEEYLRANNYKTRKDDLDRVHRGNSGKSINLILALKSSSHFLKVLRYYFDNFSNHHFEDSYKNEFINRIIYFCNLDENYIIRMLEIITYDKSFYHEKLLCLIIKKIKKENEVVLYFFKNKPLKEIGSFISDLINETNLEEVVLLIGNRNEDVKEIQYLRNSIAYSNNRALAVKFESLMKKQGVVFTDHVFTVLEAAEYNENFIEKRGNYFTSFFYKEKINEGITEFFSENNFNQLNINEFYLYKKDFRKRNNFSDVHGLYDAPMDLIRMILSNKIGSLTSKQINDLLKDEFLIFRKIKDNITIFKSNNWKYVLTNLELDKIRNWCEIEISLLDFKNIIKLNSRNSFSQQNDGYERIQLILFFKKNLS
ncbi:hypothetical protein PJJ26_05615 [Tenacibaculum finnmarkense]|nr:hypothetical protein PJJ26_05615 [Tenacibaculum finnmarkense]